MPVQQGYGSIADLVGERKKASDTITSILNKETKPNYGDAGRSFSQTMMAINDPKLFKPQTTQEAFESRRQSAIAPYAAQVSVLDSDIQKGQDEAKSIISSFQQFADNPDDLALLFDAAQNDPEEVNSSNAATFAARKAKELGLQSAKKMQAQAQLNYSTNKKSNKEVSGDIPNDADLIQSPDGKMLQPPPELTANQKRGLEYKAKSESAEKGRNQVGVLLDDIAGNYMKLAKSGGIIDPSAGAIQNLKASAKSSTSGQIVGRALGTEDQSIRQSIENSRPLLISAIRQATGMSAKAMDSNAELKFYLQAATDPKNDLKSNLNALAVLDETYGLSGNKGERSKFRDLIEQREDSPPDGVDAEDWKHMTPEERKLWK
jgi:hypothetical protein